MLTKLCVCVCSEDGECQDTDSDATDPKDCGKVKVKWTQEEVTSFCPETFSLAEQFIDKGLDRGPQHRLDI